MPDRPRIVPLSTFLIVATLLLTPGLHAAPQPSSVMGIDVEEGFDAAVLAGGLNRPLGLAREANGNLIVASDCTTCPLLRLSPQGATLAMSAPLLDPDGVAVTSAGDILMAGDTRVTRIGSLDGMADVVLVSGFSNLNDILIDSIGLLVFENDGRVRRIDGSGAIVEPPFVSLLGGGGLGLDTMTGEVLATVATADEVLRIPSDGMDQLITMPPLGSEPLDVENGPGGAFGDTYYITLGASGEIVTAPRSGGPTTVFATGFTRPTRILFTGEEELLVSDTIAPPEGRIIRIFPTRPPTLMVRIDIKPDSETNCFNANQRGVLPVVIFGAMDLDVSTIDLESLRLAGLSVKRAGRRGRTLAHFVYFDEDEHLDLVVQFEDSGAFVPPEDGRAVLTGELDDGSPIQADDALCLVPRRGGAGVTPSRGRGRGRR